MRRRTLLRVRHRRRRQRSFSWLVAGGAHASAEGPGDPAPLNTLPVPSPPNEGDFVRDPASAVKLGKALFWDMQAGSDGAHGVRDLPLRRRRRQPRDEPGQPERRRVHAHGPERHAHGAATSRCTAWRTSTNRASAVTSDTNDVVGSQGVVAVAASAGSRPATRRTCGTFGPDPIFSIGGTPVRQATTRNSPVGDQRGLQLPQLLGRPRAERLQRRQPVRRPRHGRARRARRTPPAASTRSR